MSKAIKVDATADTASSTLGPPTSPLPVSSTANFFLAGGSAVLAKTIVAPIERANLLIARQIDPPHLTVAQYMRRHVYPFFYVFSRIPKEQGILAFWRGNTSNCIRYAPTQAINFAFKEKLKQVSEWREDQVLPFSLSSNSSLSSHLLMNSVAGGIAGASSCIILYPIDMARNRLAYDTGTARQFTGTFDCIMKTARTNGWGKGGVYKGFVLSCVGIVTYRAAYFGLYDTLTRTDEMRTAGFMKKFALAYGTTITASLLSFPLHAIRRREEHMRRLAAQVNPMRQYAPYTSSFDCARTILQKEGMRAFYRDSSSVFRHPSPALILPIFDLAQSWYTQYCYRSE